MICKDFFPNEEDTCLVPTCHHGPGPVPPAPGPGPAPGPRPGPGPGPGPQAMDPEVPWLIIATIFGTISQVVAIIAVCGWRKERIQRSNNSWLLFQQIL
jgi:hypothetical protein